MLKSKTTTASLSRAAKARALTLGAVSVSMIALIAGAADAQTAAVQSAGAAAPAKLEEVVVTARKRKENIIETPLSISAFSAKSLATQGIPSVHALDEIVPSLTITNFGAGNVADASLSIRGIGTADHLILTDPGVGVYIDGVYLGRSMGNNMTLANIDQIEILRGPQGTLAGRNTLGGALNIITKEPDQKEYFEINATAGTRGRANGSFYGNAPITDTFAISATGSIEHRDGIGRFVNLPDVGTRVGQIDQVSGRLAAKWTPNDKFSAVLTIDGSDGHYGLSPMTDLIINPNGSSGLQATDLPKNGNDLGTENPALPKTSDKTSGGALTLRYKIDDHWSVKLIGSERYSFYSGGLDDDDSAIPFSEFPETGYARQFTGEGQVNAEYSRVDFVAGLYGFHEKGDADQPNYVFAGGPGQFYVGQTTTSYAGYFHTGFKVTDALKISGGVRYTHDHKDAYAFLPGFYIPFPFTERKDSWSAVTWDVDVDYRIQQNLNAYGTIQHGYESGGYPARPFGGPDTFVAYNPTYATNYEVGLKGRIGDILRFSSSIFYTQYEDLALQFSETTALGYLTITSNAGRSRTYGGELESTLLLGDHFSINDSVGYNDAKVTHVNPGTQGVAAGDVPQLTPKWTISLGPQYTTELANGATLTARIDTSYRSSMFGQSANNIYNVIKPRYLTNFNVSYYIPEQKLTLSVYGNNIFNVVYDEARIDQYDSGFTEVIRSNDRSEFGAKVKKVF